MKVKKPQLSRKVKTLIYTTIVALFLAIVIVGNFPITPWNAFRLAEKAHFVEPARILGTESVISVGQDAVIVAKSDVFCMTYGFQYLNFHDPENLVCKKKMGDLTFLSIARQSDYDDWDDEYLSIVLFDEYPQAVRAVLSIHPVYIYNQGERHEKSYTVTATREAKEYFFFRLDWEAQVDSTDGDTYFYDYILIYQLNSELNSTRTGVDPIPGTIQLYDKNDTLILEREIDLKNPNP